MEPSSSSSPSERVLTPSEQLAFERNDPPSPTAAASVPAPGSFAAFLHEAMSALEREHPTAWERLCLALRRRRVTLSVDEEIVPMAFEVDGVTFLPYAGEAHVILETDRPTIFTLVDGVLSLEEAVKRDRLRLRGRPDDVVRFHDGLMQWLHGAVRSPAFPGLLRAFRAALYPPDLPGSAKE